MNHLRRTLWALALLPALLLSWVSVAHAAIPSAERQALIDIYNSSNGAGWAYRINWRKPDNTDFSSAGSECTWYGVVCDAAGAHVTGLQLSANLLSGRLPASLSALTAIMSIDVAGNAGLGGPLPSLAGLTHLQDFDAHLNSHTGPLPSLNGLAALRNFRVYGNQLSGALPDMTGLANLEQFLAYDNQLSGALPASLADLTHLAEFNVANNRLTDAIPSLLRLTRLTSFHVEFNQLTGELPVAPSPTVLLAASSTLCPNFLRPSPSAFWDAATGETPWSTNCRSAIPTRERQVLIDLYNRTTGSGWIARTNWRNASDSDFNDVGTECTWVGVVCDAGHVTAIKLSENNLVGTLPSLTAMTELVGFDADYNQLTGGIPSLTGLTALTRFTAAGNQLTGGIPSLTGLTALATFDLSENALTGTIPSLSGLTALTYFHVGRNKLTGTIPSLSGLAALTYFYVAENQLVGSIPSLIGLTKLATFSVYGNGLSGSIPSLTDLTSLGHFDVSNNQLTGGIPSLSGLPVLARFFVDHNQLAGAVPSRPIGLMTAQLCPNHLTHVADAAWDAATGSTPWYIECIAVPGAPTLLRLMAGHNQIKVLFQPPADDGGASIVSYTARCTGNGTTRSVSGPGSPLTVTGLTDGVRYTCSVHASNGMGAGGESSSLARAAGSSVPLAPLLLLLGD